MRQIGAFFYEIEAKKLSFYLSHEGIQNHCEAAFDPQSGHMNYQVWIEEEDQLEQAAKIFEEFQKNPNDSKYNVPEPKPKPIDVNDEIMPPPMTRQSKPRLTYFFFGLCVAVFFLGILQGLNAEKQGKGSLAILPIQALLMYDFPKPFEKLEQEGTITKEEFESAIDAPYWKGFYNWVLLRFKGEKAASATGPLFEKIREGELWRLFSPCVLHKDLLHILFNMLWLWYLGRPVEQRIGSGRTLLLTLVAGIGSNTLQYLMSGPFFIGYSGVITALAGFIWMREKRAPWEGYPLTRGTILFLLIFVLAILGLQIVTFFLQIFTTISFQPNIANTAHIAGAFIGAFLGRFRFFAQRVHK